MGHIPPTPGSPVETCLPHKHVILHMHYCPTLSNPSCTSSLRYQAWASQGSYNLARAPTPVTEQMLLIKLMSPTYPPLPPSFPPKLPSLCGCSNPFSAFFAFQVCGQSVRAQPLSFFPFSVKRVSRHGCFSISFCSLFLQTHPFKIFCLVIQFEIFMTAFETLSQRYEVIMMNTDFSFF